MTASAVVLRAGDARVVIEPDHGARLTSLVLAGREWLQQPVVELRAAQPFDAFVRPDIAGWDEMVPTCVAVEHAGVALPDHGEVWSRPWHVVSADQHELTTRRNGTRSVPWPFDAAAGSAPAPDSRAVSRATANCRRRWSCAPATLAW